MKKTALHQSHLVLGAKMGSFAGFKMPIHYSGVTKEHLAVRENLGVFDVSHMGEFYISGPNSLDLLQKVCSNDISNIGIGKAQYNYLPNKTGGIIDDLIVYRLEQQIYLLVINASNIQKDWNWIKKYNKEFGAQIENHSENTALLAIQGPMALTAMQNLTDFPLNSLPYYSLTKGNFASCEDVIIATTGYTGSGGIEIYFQVNQAKIIWNAILNAGKPYGILPAGLAARDTLRTEMGYCLYGNEINETTSPIEAGLGWISKPETGFVNFKFIADQKAKGTDQKLIGFEMNMRAIPRSGYDIVNIEGDIIGLVTSGTQSPSLSKGIGLGYIKKVYSEVGTEIGILIREKIYSAHIVKLPFIKL